MINNISRCLPVTIHRHMIVCVGVLGMIGSLVFGASPVELHVAKEVQKLIPAIKANEAMFRDIELKYHGEFGFSGENKTSQFQASSKKTVHQITQGDLYWLDYNELGANYFAKRKPETVVRECVRRLKQCGFNSILEPIELAQAA